LTAIFMAGALKCGRPYIKAITSPIATKAFRPVTAIPR
jgi:hypothetical protein